MQSIHRILSLGICIAALGSTLGCSSLPPVKTQAYARLPSEQVFEEEFETVWKAIETSLSKTKITRTDPSEITPQELARISQSSIETDWVYSRSKTKYIEYSVNGFPRKTYLQNRYQYRVKATRVIGGIQVSVHVRQELERLDEKGLSAGFTSAEESDSSLSNDLLEKIKAALRSNP
jgi:hypothetical protein